MLGAIKDKALRVALRAILDRFCARRLYAIVGRDEETACQVEQRNWSRNKWIGPPGAPLTKITPYKVFGRLRDDPIHARRRQAYEKRQ